MKINGHIAVPTGRANSSVVSYLGSIPVMLSILPLAFVNPAQQDRRSVHPTEIGAHPTRITVRPTRFEWGALLQVQSSLPPMSRPVEQAPQGMIEKPIVETPELDARLVLEAGRGSDHMLPDGQGSSERLAPCASFPSIPAASLSTVSQGDGMDTFGSFFFPANGAGAIGPNHLMTMAANTTLIQDRLGATISSVDTLTFWSPLTPPSVAYCRLDYEVVSDRWIATARGGSGVGACTILFAISDSDDPTLGWTFYSIDADPGFTTFPDGLKMGHNSTWVAVTADMYTSMVAGGNAGSRLYTFDMAAAIAGGPVTATIFSASFVTATTGLFTPAVNFRNVPVRSLDTSIADLWILNSRATSGSSVAWQAIRLA